MLAEGLMALALLAGRTVVSAATTDAWQAAKRGVAPLFGRSGPRQEQLTEQRLEQTHDQLASLNDAELEQARSVLAAQWATRLADLLEEDPDAEADLRALVRQIQQALPAGVVSAADHAVAAGRDLNVNADHGGVAAGVIHGNVVPANPPGPGPANG